MYIATASPIQIWWFPLPHFKVIVLLLGVSLSYTGTHSTCVVSLDNEPEVSDLVNEVAAKIPKKWRDVGLQLGLDPSELDGIAIESPSDTNYCYMKVFTRWKNKNSAEHPYTWSTIVCALQVPAVGEERLANEIETGHLSRKIWKWMSSCK